MEADKLLIVNADDFGQSPGISEGIVEAVDRGIVTSASLMVRWPDAGEAVRRWRQRDRRFSLGLHVDLGEWWFDGREWRPRYVVTDPLDDEAVAAEIERQLARFVELAGEPPAHLDSHQHVHRREPVLSALRAVGDRLEIPVREQSPGISYLGSFYGQTDDGEMLPDHIGVDALVAHIESIDPGVTELGCHPGLDVAVDTTYRRERRVELQALTSPQAAAAVRRTGVRMVGFGVMIRRAGTWMPREDR